MWRVAGRQRQGGGRGRTDDAPVVRTGDPRVLVAVEGSYDLVHEGAEGRLQRDLVALGQLLEVTERLAEPGAVSGDRDVSARGARQRRPGIVARARAQCVPADP